MFPRVETGTNGANKLATIYIFLYIFNEPPNYTYKFFLPYHKHAAISKVSEKFKFRGYVVSAL